MSQPPIFDARDEAEQNVASIQDTFCREGFVCLRLLEQEECDELVLEQWKEILWRQPWLPEYKIRVQSEPDGRQLHIERDKAAFLQAVKGPLSTERRKHYEQGWCFHRGFGACCDPAVFHLKGVWKLRQNPQLFEVAARLSGTRKLWVDINRSIQKLPGQGENEFLHWDLNPFSEATLPAPASHSICGKEFVRKYQSIYPDVRRNAAKFGLDPAKDDPLRLFEKRQEFRIPAGCVVLWSERLLHGQVKTPLNEEVEYGCYLGYFPAGAREGYKAVCGVDELEDRLLSYSKGQAPQLWPSLDRIHFYPARFKNFPHLLEAYVRKMPPHHPMITSRVTAKGKTVPDLTPTPAPHYTPPTLSALGQRLLGLQSWEAAAAVTDDRAGANDGGGAGGERRQRKRGLGEGSGQEKGRSKRFQRAVCAWNSLEALAGEGARAYRGNAKASSRALLVTKKQAGYGLRADMEVYCAGLEAKGWEVVCIELERHSKTQLAKVKGGRECDTQLRQHLPTSGVLIGFEFLGDSATWACILEERAERAQAGRSDLTIVLVPNLEYTKQSCEASSDTMQNLSEVNLIVAKSEDVFLRLHRLFLRRRFRHGSGLLLVPHTTMTKLPDIERDPARRSCIIHFAGSSHHKNTQANCAAALMLLSKYPDIFAGGLVIKCSHKPAADGAACKICNIARWKREAPSGAKVELVEHALTENQKRELYGRCRLALCASAVEGFGHYILEAAAYGCQVVTTDGMPMRSLLRVEGQSALAAPAMAGGRPRNLGLEYKVTAESIFLAAETLVSGPFEYSPPACRRNLELQLRSFQSHLDILDAHLRVQPALSADDGEDGESSMCGQAFAASCFDHAHASFPGKGSRELCKACGGVMHGELRAVNHQAQDRLEFVCVLCGPAESQP